MPRKQTYPQKVVEKLKTLKKVGQSFSKKVYIKEVWGDYDYYIDRSFDVAFASAKKLLPEMIFKTIDGNITRTQ